MNKPAAPIAECERMVLKIGAAYVVTDSTTARQLFDLLSRCEMRHNTRVNNNYLAMCCPINSHERSLSYVSEVEYATLKAMYDVFLDECRALGLFSFVPSVALLSGRTGRSGPFSQ